ncbi:tRNA (adenosine(37)-N6)-threonylcarbamoyltransferase complex ATPase subunit type 1 TsaE [Pseudooceanicola sp.]|uniref:tRNA (adenosine(37)-N6)-threonylcarbamoyltransferase complex ATPase subunit type 1 TsaE n=1 Tax=Pseudooceanicola sp. TaxID=1914328 RepID=UPI0035160C79
MGQFSVTHDFTSEEDTCRAAARLAPLLRPGHVILLEGGIGAGKTHFARCLIRAVLAVPEDVPSPTFTLVQTYETAHGELWHSDLYRLGHPDDVIELGLAEAFESAICLVEWPDRLGELTPPGALHIGFSVVGDSAREIVMRADETPWRDILKEAGLDR